MRLTAAIVAGIVGTTLSQRTGGNNAANTGNNGADSGGNALSLDPNNVQKGSQSTGQEEANSDAGQAASKT